MNLDDIFNQLSYGELAQVMVGNDDAGLVPASDYPRIAASVSLGLTELHKRFLIKETKIRIELVEGISTYVLDSKFAESNVTGTEPNKYIKDSAEPFLDNVLKIERVYDSSGNEVTLNILEDEDSIMTSGMNVLVLPAEVEYEYIDVVYRANHPALNKANVLNHPLRVEIDLPISYLEALLFYVASRVMNPIGMISEFHEGNNYAAKFEAACIRLEQLNIKVENHRANDRLADNGWV